MHTLKQASEILGLSIPALKKRIYTGKLEATKALNKQGKLTWQVNLPSDPPKNQYPKLLEQWLSDMRTGRNYPKPFSPKTITSRTWYIGDLWKHSQKTPSLQNLNQETLKEAFKQLSTYEKCRFSTKEGILKAYRAFATWLILKGLSQKAILQDLSTLKPKRFLPPKRIKLQNQEVQHMLKNLQHYPATHYHKARMTLLLEIILYSGLRIAEALSLKPQDIRLDAYEIQVLGKGNKRRITTLPKALKNKVLTWLKQHHKTGQSLFNNMTYNAARIALKRLAKHSHLDIPFHGLRRTRTTHWVDQGTPITMVARLLGHSDIKTTQIYVEADALQAIRFVSQIKQII